MKIQEFYAYVCVKEAAKAIEFYKEAFGAKETLRLVEPGGRIGHAQLDFGCATLMLSDAFPEYGTKSSESLDGTRSFQFHLHVDNSDDFIEHAVKLGAKVVREIENQFYGERSGSIKDPFGLQWTIGHHVEDMTPQEMQRRYEEFLKKERVK